MANNFKQQIADFRKSTPKHIQWLLLAAAFIVVLILLTLLFTGKHKSPTVIDESDPAELILTPTEIDWSNTTVGEPQSETIVIHATAPVNISDVRQSSALAGFNMTENCKKIAQIDETTGCKLKLSYSPTSPMQAKQIKINIVWRAANLPDEFGNTITPYRLTLGAEGTPYIEPEPAPDPVVTPEPEPEPEPVIVPEPAPVTQPIQEIEPILPPAIIPEPVPVVAPTVTPEACSDFAIPGYNSAGRQIGWIKPENGAYYFHPFSDKNCSAPTGIYNPDNGLITDIKNAGKRIGTDAEHIGYGTAIAKLPELSNPATITKGENAKDYNALGGENTWSGPSESEGFKAFSIITKSNEDKDKFAGSGSADAVYSTQPYDRRFILRQYKPIPATIVSDVRADPSIYGEGAVNVQLPVRATVDRNVYADNGRTIIIPTGTLLMGYVTGELPGPYTSIGRMQIKWYQFILPNGVEFNFSDKNQDAFSADAQGRVGVPGRGSTDYLEQFVMPMLTAIVPAAVNMIAPVADKFVNQIDLDNNTVVQSGTMRSSELAKNEIITAWNQVAQKLMVDMMDNTVPPFSIAAGTRITVYSPVDLIVNCAEEGKSCHMASANNKNKTRRTFGEKGFADGNLKLAETGWIGQVREFQLGNLSDGKWCTCDDTGACHASKDQTVAQEMMQKGYSYSTVEFYCQTLSYKAINIAKQEAYYQNQTQQFQDKYETSNGNTQGNNLYKQEILGLKYEDDGATIKNPFASEPKPAAEPVAPTIGCLDGTAPDANGCCTGEIYTDMGEDGFNCCPAGGGDCFPPIL